MIMKPIGIVTATLLSIVLVGCSKYDDSALESNIRSLETRIQNLEQRCNEMNQNIVSLQSLINAMQQNKTITDVSQTDNGYIITFSNKESITITNGKDGKNGEDAVTPVISVKQESDGMWYWTVNGSWLLDSNGNKIRANGIDGTNGKDAIAPVMSAKQDADGMWYWTINGSWLFDSTGNKIRANGIDGTNGKDAITPMLKIENEYWYISYDNGGSWEKLQKAVGDNGKDGKDGADGDSFFKSVTQDNDYVYFELADGAKIQIPKEKKLALLFNKTTIASVAQEMSIDFEVKGAPGNVKVMAFSDPTMTVRVNMKDNDSGELIVKFIGEDRSGNVMVAAKTANDSCFELIEFVQGILTTSSSKELSVPDSGGSLNLSVTHDMAITVKSEADWISPVQTKATVTDIYSFTVAKNETFSPRKGKIVVRSTDDLFDLEFNVTQAQKNKLVLDKHELQINVGGTYSFKVDTNLDNLVWKSSNATAVKVDQNGTVTGVAAGTSTITVTSQDGSISDSCVVTSKAFTITDYVSFVRTNGGSMYIVNGMYKVDFRIDNKSSETIYVEKIGSSNFGWYEVNHSVEGNSSYSLSIYGTSNLYGYYQYMTITWGGKSYNISEQR